MSRLRRLWLAPLLVVLFACNSAFQGWHFDSLARRHPTVNQVPGHRLADALPYFALAPGGLSLFLCRWSVEEPVSVWLPESASPGEIAILEQALRAWEGAGLGVRFEARVWGDRSPLSGVVFEIIEPDVSRVAPAGTTVADCAIPPAVSSGGEDLGAPIDAELEYASIRLLRSRPDLLGRHVPISDNELLGAAIHELGHALGFSGHVAGGGSVMSRHGQLDAVRRWGRRIAAGETLEAPSLAALYAVPNGVRVGWLPLTRCQLVPLRGVSAVGARRSFRGPFVRVGDASARWLWRDRHGDAVAVVVLDWPAVLQDPERLQARLNRSARVLLEADGGR